MVVNYAEASIGSLIGAINEVIINPIIGFLFALALVYFFWGLIKFLANRGRGEDDVTTGKKHMLWGIIGMFIMVSVFGILNFITNSLGERGIDPQNQIEQDFAG